MISNLVYALKWSLLHEGSIALIFNQINDTAAQENEFLSLARPILITEMTEVQREQSEGRFRSLRL